MTIRCHDYLSFHPDLHPGTVLDWKRPDSTAGGSNK